jgi:hypothetical protein
MRIYKNVYKAPNGTLLTYPSLYLSEEEAREKGRDQFLQTTTDGVDQYDIYQFTFWVDVAQLPNTLNIV